MIEENSDGSINYKGYVDFNGMNFETIPFKFKIVKGWFSCYGCTLLTSLEGCPQSCEGFYCSGCT
ncbi:MAG: hypothetical protein ACKO96_37020, partial [Flammeovirgaceae bacterium]